MIHICVRCHKKFTCTEHCNFNKGGVECNCEPCDGFSFKGLCKTRYVTRKNRKPRKGKLIGGYEIQ